MNQDKMPSSASVEPSIQFDDKGQSWSISPNERDFIEAAERDDFDTLKKMHANLGNEFGKFNPNAGGNCRKTALHHSTSSGNVKMVEWLLKTDFNGVKMDVKQADGWGSSPLHLAGENGGVELINALLNAKADVNSQNEMGLTPLHLLASQKPTVETARLLCGLEEVDVNVESKCGETALMAAVSAGNKVLYEAIMGNRKLRQSIELGIQFQLGKNSGSLLDEGDGNSILLYAVRNGDSMFVDDILLSAGDSCVFPMWKTDGTEEMTDDNRNYWRDKLIAEELLNLENKKGTTPLMSACSTGKIEVVQKILLCGELLLRQAEEDADPDDIFDLNLVDKRGNSALHIATAFGYANQIQALLLFSNYFGKDKAYPFKAILQNIVTNSHFGKTKSSLASSEKLLAYLEENSDSEDKKMRKFIYSEIIDNIPKSVLESVDTEKTVEVVKLELNDTNKEKIPAVIMAVRDGRLDVAETLLTLHDGSLDLKAKDPKGKTAKQKAIGGGHDSIVALLKNYKFVAPK